jgi:hypothetical protein
LLKFAFNYLTSFFSLLENPLYNYIVMVIIGIFSFRIAYLLVGWFYNNHFISGRNQGSNLHWFIRTIVFVCIYFLIATMIRIYNWLQGHTIIVIYSVAAVLLFGTLLYVFINWRREA